jgi:carbamoyltransferase
MPDRSPAKYSVLGINRTSDASVCLLDEGGVRFSVAKERLNRVKHAWGALGDVRELYAPRLALGGVELDAVVECYSSDEERHRTDEYRQEILETLRFRDEPRIVHVSHHLAHTYGAFFPSPFEHTAVMVIDFQGSHVQDCTEAWPGREHAPPHALEVASYYVCRGREVECVGKQLWDQSAVPLTGLGGFYNALTHTMLPSDGQEGIVMGLSPFGDPDAFRLPPLEVREGAVTIPEEWRAVIADRERFGFLRDGKGSFQRCADLAAAGQRAFEAAVLEMARWLREATGAPNLVFTGGCALNCAANTELIRSSGFERMFVPPAPHDGGTAIGCAIYGAMQSGHEPAFRWTRDYLGPAHDADAFVRELAGDGRVTVSVPDDLAASVAEIIAGGEVVCLFQGGSESGPRALGNRSIIADPRFPVMTTFINEKVKGRQWFRPLAPAVLEEAADEYFVVDRPSPFMQFAVEVRPEMRRALAAVTHVDGTARIQTVTSTSNPFLHALLVKFAERTGTRVLMNTSYNGRGEPIVEAPGEALDCFLNTPTHALVIPPYLIRKTAEMPHPYAT